MPSPEVILDTVRDAELQASATNIQYIRGGFVRNIDLSSTADADALVKVLSLLPALGSSLSDSSTKMQFRSVRVFPEDGKFGQVRLQLLYDTLGPNVTPTAYMIRDRSYSVQKTDCFLPGTRTPVVVGFSDSDNPGLAIPPQPVFFDFDVTARSILLTVLKYGRPDGGAMDYMNYTNDSQWPLDGQTSINKTQFNPGGWLVSTATGLPKGYWRLNQYSTDYNVNAGMVLIQSEAVTQVSQDWSVVGMVRNEQTGKYPFASLPTATITTELAALNNPDYKQGIIYSGKGIVRAGPYPMTNFKTLFGF